MPSSEIQIHGYAIISDDDRIADSGGRTPPSLRNDADWAYFQRELDGADLSHANLSGARKSRCDAL